MNLRIKNSLVVCILSISLLSACGNKGGGNTSVNADGSCTDQFRSDYNIIGDTFLKLKEAEGYQQVVLLKEISSSCDNFRRVHASSVSCKGEMKNRETGAKMGDSADASTIYDICTNIVDPAIAKINQIEAEQNTTNQKPRTPPKKKPAVDVTKEEEFD